MKIISGILFLASAVLFQTGDAALFGTYVFNPTRKIELKKDHTFVESNGDDWRNGMWKLSHDTLVLQDGMIHNTHPRQAPPVYASFFLLKQGMIINGVDYYKKLTKK
jgi:hypothetical protein